MRISRGKGLCKMYHTDEKCRLTLIWCETVDSLNSHFPHQKPQHNMLRVEKAEPRTPHFLSLNQDIVACSQEVKCM
jgi:hypothetical protein